MKHFSPWFVLAPSLFSAVLFTSGLARAQECSSDADCGERHSCSFDETDAAWDCSAEAGSEAECTPREPTQSEVGWCTPDPYLCSRDADCPEPTECGEKGECVFHFETCNANSECNAGYACTVAGRQGSCSSDHPGANEPPRAEKESSRDQAGDVNSADRAPEGVAAETEPECEEQEIRICFPEPVSCQTSADCTGDWTCEEIPEGGPEGWESIDRACLPPGITALIDGHIRAEGDDLGESASNDQGRADDSDKLIESMPTSGESPTELGTQGGSEGSSGGCSLAAVHSASGRGAAWSSLLGLVFAFAALRRRQQG